MDYKKRIDRINDLALKAKESNLTKEEIQERDTLRREYVANTFRFVEEEAITLVKQ